MLFATDAVSIFTTRRQSIGQNRILTKRILVHALRFFSHFSQTDPFDLCRCSGEIFGNKGRIQTNRFKYLRAAIGLIGGNTHLGHDLHQALVDRLDETLLSFIGIDSGRQIERRDCFKGKPRANRFCTVTCQQREVMHFTSRTRFNDQTGAGAQPCLNQMLMHARAGNQGWNRDAFTGHGAVRQNQHVVTIGDRLIGRCTQGLDVRSARFCPCADRISDIQYQ